jgi:hypothetical protein
MNDHKFTFQELADFIGQQSDTRPVHMGITDDTYNCGCVLIHFGRRYFHRNIKAVGFRLILNDRDQYLTGDDKTFDFIDMLIKKKPKTYKQVKKYLSNF